MHPTRLFTGCLLLTLVVARVPGGDQATGNDGLPDQRSQDSPVVRILSYNIHAGKDADGKDNLARVAEVIREAGADLILLQEVDRGTERSGEVDQLEVLAEATGLSGAFGKTLDYQGGEYGIALLSRWPILRNQMRPLPVEPPQERAGGSHEPRGALHAEVQAPMGEIHVLNTHLDASGDDTYRWQEIQQVLGVVDSLRALGATVVFGGDLNALPDTRVVEEARTRGWTDGWEACGSGDGSTYPAGAPVRRIDYLLLGNGLGCSEARVVPTIASDHRPVAVTVAREEGSGPTSAQAVPDTDIWLFPLAPSAAAVDGAAGVRVTRRPGYDNQPSFLPDGRTLLYTAIDDSGQADIWRYDLDPGRTGAVTRTSPESEYSPTVMPSGDRFSTIRVEADSTQRLWSFDLEGGTPRLELPGIQPVGYHAWLDDDRLVLFVLGEPATLELASWRGGTSRVVARNIGRSLFRIPGRGTASFVQLEEGTAGWITEYDPATGQARRLAPLLEGNEYHAWTPHGILVTGTGSRLFRWRLGISEAWEEVADLASAGVVGISRLAVSPDGLRLAVVASGR